MKENKEIAQNYLSQSQYEHIKNMNKEAFEVLKEFVNDVDQILKIEPRIAIKERIKVLDCNELKAALYRIAKKLFEILDERIQSGKKIELQENNCVKFIRVYSDKNYKSITKMINDYMYYLRFFHKKLTVKLKRNFKYRNEIRKKKDRTRRKLKKIQTQLEQVCRDDVK